MAESVVVLAVSDVDPEVTVAVFVVVAVAVVVAAVESEADGDDAIVVLDVEVSAAVVESEAAELAVVDEEFNIAVSEVVKESELSVTSVGLSDAAAVTAGLSDDCIGCVVDVFEGDVS